MLAIKNNLMAENAARHLGDSYDSLATSVERLSSGLRINTAKDDAAGLAARELMRADIAVLTQGSRNARDGISMLQTMEGAMATIDQALVRMKELAEQAATGTYSDQQRRIMHNEFAELANEIDRIANKTEFNGVKMLNSAGTSASVSIHFGQDSSGNDSQITVSSVDVTKTGLGIDSASLTSAAGAISALTVVNNAIEAKDSARASFGYNMNRLEYTDGVLNITRENMLASESRISDVDVATEVANMTRTQVLSQAGISMLTQANSIPQMAMSLL
jgi:flagellin